ncbi:MAG: hypothetical protein H7A12_04365 [Pseudomonadales bacterium]|nr:hypothetical protein [Pseudomonadales bacterium]MCP5338208.1 hypothetical protein [Pseudomonadales bacterium]
MPHSLLIAFCAVVCFTLSPGFSAPVRAAGSGDDAVNERPPVTSVQRERHWHVDCERLRQELLQISSSHAVSEAYMTRWRESLALCAAIHNTPGTPAAGSCPDYAGARRVIAATRGDAGPDLISQLRRPLACEP